MFVSKRKWEALEDEVASLQKKVTELRAEIEASRPNRDKAPQRQNNPTEIERSFRPRHSFHPDLDYKE